MEQPQSPLPKEEIKGEKEKLMTFSEALESMLKGKKITRKEWDEEKMYGYIEKDDILCIQLEGLHQWILRREDLEAKDWITIN